VLAIEITAEFCNPEHHLRERRRFGRRLRCAVYPAIQRAPFDRLQQHFAGQVAIKAESVLFGGVRR
jgi:hypothetical protein